MVSFVIDREISSISSRLNVHNLVDIYRWNHLISLFMSKNLDSYQLNFFVFIENTRCNSVTTVVYSHVRNVDVSLCWFDWLSPYLKLRAKEKCIRVLTMHRTHTLFRTTVRLKIDKLMCMRSRVVSYIPELEIMNFIIHSLLISLN